MKQTALRVFLACFIGAFIGTLIAIRSGIFWWAGLLIGGLAGYLSYEFKAVVIAVKEAMRDIRRELPGAAKTIGFYFFAILMVFANGIIPTLLSLWNVKKVDEDFSYILFAASSLMLGIFISFLIFICLAFSSSLKGGESEEFEIEKKWGRGVVFFVFFTPIGIYLILPFLSLRWALKTTPKAIILLLRWIPKIMSESIVEEWQVIKKVFITIHSEVRLLCGVDAMLGAFVGYLFWNPLLGALAGGMLGVANYYLISIKLLKLVPVSSEK